ncbi:MAG: sigma factor-like helix-turn-helix DNA-binding protein [Acidimicrobiales bacterium]
MRSPERAPAWLARVAASVVADHFRERRPLTTTRDPVAPAHASDLAWAAQCLPAMLDELPEPYRDALRLDLAGVTQREIARTSGISVSGAKSRVQRGRARLRERYLACCDVEVGAHGIVDVTPRPPVPPTP